MSIYTKTGDKGETSLFTGRRVKKNDNHVEAYGTLDECTSSIGCAIAFLPKGALHSQLSRIQNELLHLGSQLATPRQEATKAQLERTQFSESHAAQLESEIDAMDSQLAPLKTFILPGGCQAASFLHLARTICRRCERQVIALVDSGDCELTALIYLNRLSDYLFTAARFANHVDGIGDILKI